MRRPDGRRPRRTGFRRPRPSSGDESSTALHRGAISVSGVQFQGKDDAFVNFGSQIHAILADIRDSAPAVADAIEAAQSG